jgi:hypothetical protein
MGEVVDWRSFLPVFSRGSVEPTQRARVPHVIYTSIDGVSAKNVPFRGIIDTSHPMGSYPQNPLIAGTWNFQLKRLRAYLQGHADETDQKR